MAGRALLGLSPGERHRAEFQPSPLPDEPQVTVWLIAGAALVALAVILVGWEIHQPALDSLPMHHGLCGPYGTVPMTQGPRCPRPDLTWWQRIPMTVWFVYAGLAAALVVIGPFIAYRVKHSTGQV